MRFDKALDCAPVDADRETVPFVTGPKQLLGGAWVPREGQVDRAQALAFAYLFSFAQDKVAPLLVGLPASRGPRAHGVNLLLGW